MRRFHLFVVLLLVGCGDDAPAGTIDRAAFVGTWVELRAAAARTDGSVLSSAERERILAERGTTADELAAFVDAHGEDLAYMDDLWREVLDSLQARGVGTPLPEVGPGATPPPGEAPSPDGGAASIRPGAGR